MDMMLGNQLFEGINSRSIREVIDKGVIYSAVKKMNDLKSSCDAFNKWWPKFALDAVVWPLPVPEKRSDVNVSWLPALDEITFDQFSTEDAIPIIQKSLSYFYRGPKDPALNIRRYPGYVRLSSNVRNEMVKYLSRINLIKKELRSIIGLIPDGIRSTILRKLWPGEHILAAYRLIHFGHEDIRLIHFTWQGRPPQNEQLDKKKLLLYLENELLLAIQKNDMNKAYLIDDEVKRLSILDDSADIVFRKRLAPSPRLLAYYFKPTIKTGVADIAIQCPVPFFFSQDFPARINPLPEWNIDMKQIRGRRSDEYMPIIPRLKVFLRKKYH